MTQPDPVNNPPVSFVGRLNRTLCFFWLILNVVLFICAIYTVFRASHNIDIPFFPTTEEMKRYQNQAIESLYNSFISGALIIDGGYALIYSLIITIVYLASGRLLNPLGNKLTTLFTFWGFVVGGVTITLVLLVKLTGVTLYR
jgi:hypothetical protein